MSEATGPIVLLRQGELDLAIRLEHCLEVHRNMEITPVLGGNDAEGVINLRGELVPVVDLAAALGVPPRQSVLRRRIVICQWQTDRIGVLVDDVLGIQESSQELRRRPSTFPDGLQGFCLGITQVHGRLCFLLDVRALLEGRRVPSEEETA
ncbi:MAG: chemotaxis protein CheW [Planctomycetota bacterium]